MRYEDKTKEQLLSELKKLRQRITALKISEKKRTHTEEALKESEEKALTLINATIDFVTLIDKEGTILEVNNEVCKSINKPRDELIGMCIYEFDDLVTPELIRYRRSRINEGVCLKKPIFFEDEFKGRHLDVRIHPVCDAHGNVNQIAIFSRDITQRKQAEKKLIDYQNQLRSLTSQLTLAEEQERRRIATDLHDRIGQTLSISYIKLGAMREPVSAINLEKDVDAIREMIDQTIKDTHSLTFDLCPPFLYELGFEKALECLVEEFQNQHGLTTLFKSDGKFTSLDNEVTILLFRTVRELLTNIVKHARAQKAQVSIGREKNTIQIVVEDDGIGFNPNTIKPQIDRKGGFGLFSIQERLHFLGGEMKVESEPTKGTRISLMVPLRYKGKLRRRKEDERKNSSRR
jgi:PAS domain S-box-containing protein